MENLSFAYPSSTIPALRDVSAGLTPGQVTLVLGRSGSGKSTLLRAFAGLVPHFHGGRFSGRVEVAGLDTRRHGPARLAGTVATLFQDPEEQVVFTRVLNEVAFGLEHVGTPAQEIEARALEALESVGAEHLSGRLVTELSGGELQRVCLAATLALEPRLLLLDEPTSQLDPEAARALLDLARRSGIAVVCSEQRPALPLERADRVVFLDRGRVLLDAPRERALEWLRSERPACTEPHHVHARSPARELVCRVTEASFA